MGTRTVIPKCVLTVINQLYEIEEKLKRLDNCASLRRNIDKMKDAFAEEGLPAIDVGGGSCSIRLTYEDPMGQPFKETRTDLDATIAGVSIDNLFVVEVIKPIIRITVKDGGPDFSRVVQKGIVIVESRKEQ